MYKIFISARNRLSITAKCISAIQKFSVLPHEIYIADNLTNYQIDEHFMYWCLLYKKGIIKQVVFNTKESTFNAFSKAVSCNLFGYNHEMDPNKDKIDFLVFLDNDCIIVQPGWDKIISNAWNDVRKFKLKDIKVIGQLPGGITSKKEVTESIAGYKAKSGVSGGSAFWTVPSNFFTDIGYLNIRELVGYNKKHDQNYWKKLSKATNGRNYILGLDVKLVIHTGKFAGSVCNTLSKNRLSHKNPEHLINFEESEKKINEMSFDEFYNLIINDTSLNDW